MLSDQKKTQINFQHKKTNSCFIEFRKKTPFLPCGPQQMFCVFKRKYFCDCVHFRFCFVFKHFVQRLFYFSLNNISIFLFVYPPPIFIYKMKFFFMASFLFLFISSVCWHRWPFCVYVVIFSIFDTWKK